MKRTLFPFSIQKIFVLGLAWMALAVPCTASVSDTVIVRLPFDDASPSHFGKMERRFIKRPCVGLVLGGGGARGIAHIGVLKVLERENIRVRRLVGTSMGSVVGGLYAIGLSAEEIAEHALSVNWSRIFSNTPQRSDLFPSQKRVSANHILEFRTRQGKPIVPTGLTAGHRLVQYLSDITLESDFHSKGDFDNYPIPFRAVATDMVTGKRVILKRGPLAEAMRTSVAVPFAFTPVEYDSMLLFDGGMVDNLPTGVATEMGADYVIAVDIKAPLKPKQMLKNPLEILDQIVTLTILNQPPYRPDSLGTLIVPDLDNHLSTNFTNLSKLIALGEKAAEKALPEIRKELRALAIPLPEFPALPLREIHVEGNAKVDEMVVRQALDLPKGMRMVNASLMRALERVYETGNFRDVWAQWIGEADSAVLVVHVREYGPKKGISFQGNTVFTNEELESHFSDSGETCANWYSLHRSSRTLLEKYRKAGYPLASVERVEERDDLRILHINEGIVRGITFRGNEHTKDMVIERELVLQRGRIFRLRDAKETIQRIYSTNLFERVILEVQPGINLVFRVYEKEPTRIQFGLRYDEVRLGEGYMRYIADNLWGSGNQWINLLQYGLRREKYSTFLSGDRLGGSYLFHRAGLYVYRDKRYLRDPAQPNEITLRTLRKIGISVAAGRHFRGSGSVSAILRTENFLSDSLDLDWMKRNLKSYSNGIRTLTLRSTVDNLDKLPFPTKGEKHYLAMDFAHDVAGGTEQYVNFVASAGKCFTFQKDHTLYPRLQITYADKPLPPVEQHSLGGYSTVLTNDDMSFYNDFPFMGYEERAFSGDCLALLNLRYRWRVLPWLYLLFQYDVGETWVRQEFQLSRAFAAEEARNLKQGTGIGISLDTPIGPATAVLSQPLNAKTKTESERAQWYYLSIGHDF